MAEQSQQAPAGYGWPDVAMHIIDFARTEPITFVSVVLVLAAGIGFVFWFLLPRVTKSCEAMYSAAVKAQRKAKQDAPPLPLEQDDD